MLERASGQFTIEGQVEDILGGTSGVARLARISQTCRFSGALEGESVSELTAVLPRENDGRFQGYQRISGTLGEREGSFVVQVAGAYAKGHPRGEWTIVPKSGTGDFTHIRGGGSFSQPAGKPASYSLEFDLRKPRKTAERTVAEDRPVSDEPPVTTGRSAIAEGQSAVPPKRSRRKAVPPEVSAESAKMQSAVPDETKPRRAPRKKRAPEAAIEAMPVQMDVEVARPAPARAKRTTPAKKQSVPLPVEPVERARSRRSEAA